MDFLEWIYGFFGGASPWKKIRLSTQNEFQFAKVLTLDWCHQYHSYQSTSWGWSVFNAQSQSPDVWGIKYTPEN